MATIPTGYPTAETTGVPDGTALTTYNGTLIVDQDNAVIRGLRITGNVVINAQNVTMENCIIDTTTPWNAILIPDGYTGFTLRNSEINGNGRTVNAISGSGTLLNNDIHGVENGINLYGASLIQDNYIHDLAGGPEAHFDGIENNGASNVQIIHNTVINDHNQTSAVMLDTYFGNLRNITVDDNYLVGGGYTIYLDGRFSGGTVDDDSIRITNNQIVSGYWGPFAFYDDDPVQFGNVVDGVLVGGTDTIQSSISLTLPADVQNLTLTGTADIDGTGNNLNNLLVGNSGNNVLDGKSGADTMRGGAGNDIYRVDSAGDQVIEAVGGGTDRVYASVSWTVAAGQDIEYLRAYGAGATSGVTLTGNELDDFLIGDSGVDVLNGGAGNDRLVGRGGADIMTGGAGDDIYHVDNAGDKVIEAVGGGTDGVCAGVSWAMAAGQEIETLRAYGAEAASGITLTGNELDNSLIGGLGNDVLVGGAGNDTFRFDSALGPTNIDTISDFSPTDDIIALDDAVFTGLVSGLLSISAFSLDSASGSAAQIVYNHTTGALFYDSNGSAAGGSTQFATVTGAPSLTNSSFRVV